MKFVAGVLAGLILHAVLARSDSWRRLVWWVFTRDIREGWFR